MTEPHDPGRTVEPHSAPGDAFGPALRTAALSAPAATTALLTEGPPG
jgi:hypothetical protein